MPDDDSRAELFLAQELGVRDFALARRELAGVDVALVLSPELEQDRLGQLALLTAANILCRLGPYCPSVAIAAPREARVLPGIPLLEPSSRLGTALCRFMADIQNPEQRAIRAYRTADANDSFSLALVIGRTGVQAGRILYGRYERWTGGYGSSPCQTSYRGPNVFGALIAGALGATAVARLLLKRVADPRFAPQPLPGGATLSAYSYAQPSHPELEPDLPPSVDLRSLEPMLLVGGGAVASGMAFALAALENARGVVDVVDDDDLNATNLERHLVSTWDRVGMLKAERLASIFGNGAWNGLRFRPRRCRYEALDQGLWPTIISAVDNAEVRRQLQFDLPRVIFNAGTVGSEFLVSRHDYSDGPCLECLYPERQTVKSQVEVLAERTGLEVGDVARLLATGVPLSATEIEQVSRRGSLLFPRSALKRAKRNGIVALVEEICTAAKLKPGMPVATIGFVAALPGVLLAAEMVKEVMVVAGDRPPLEGARNVFRIDTFGALRETVDISRPSRACRCRDAVMQRAYRHRWGEEVDPR